LRLIAKANDSTADDSLPSEMSLENALKLLGVREGASFDEILTAKKTMVDSCRGDQARITQVEAAYDMLLMQSLSLRQAGKVADNTIRYADVRKRKSPVSGSGPEWLRTALKNAPVAFETPSLSALGTQTGVFVALSIWMFASGLMSSPSESSLSGGADVSGVILAIGFGVSLYFLRKQNLKLGKHNKALECTLCFHFHTKDAFGSLLTFCFILFCHRSCNPFFSRQLRTFSSVLYMN